MIHNTVMVVDGIWTTIGSINFVNRSIKKNAEANVAIYDRGFAEIVEKSIVADLEKSQEITKRMWKKRGFLARMGEIVFWLFSENY
jgi:cardiolipin synthase